MLRSQRFRDQHDGLLEIVALISKELTVGHLAQDAKEVRTLLSKFMGKLQIHLAMEDKSLYPSLMSHGDEKIKAMATQFSEEMGFIAEAAESYNNDWATAKLIQENPAEFIAATRGLIDVLGKRIQKENSHLYAALDKLSA